MRITTLALVVALLLTLSSSLFAVQTLATKSGEMVQVDKTPTMVSSPEGAGNKLIYPAAAKKDSVQGTVMINLTIGKDGSVSDVTVAKGVRADLDQSALNYVRNAKFTPAEFKGEPVAVVVTVPVRFVLKAK
jgi:TonB family protein